MIRRLWKCESLFFSSTMQLKLLILPLVAFAHQLLYYQMSCFHWFLHFHVRAQELVLKLLMNLEELWTVRNQILRREIKHIDINRPIHPSQSITCMQILNILITLSVLMGVFRSILKWEAGVFFFKTQMLTYYFLNLATSPVAEEMRNLN